MPLKMPKLDDRRYKDLVEEARGLIPTYAPEWTNHNPSDPGIMLIELFAYLTEMLNYRLDRVTDENKKKFLKLLNGPDWEPGPVLQEDVRQTVLGIRERYRAVTCEDFELLVTENFNRLLTAMKQKEDQKEDPDQWWKETGLDRAITENWPSQVGLIKRARCVPQRNIEAGSESERRERKPGHISVMIVPDNDASGSGERMLLPTKVQRQAVWFYLDRRRTLTTRHHVAGPLYAPVALEAIVVSRVDVPAGDVQGRAVTKVTDLLSPVPAGEIKREWPFGRDVYVSEVVEALENVDGVDYIPDLVLLSECGLGEASCVAAESIWHDEGDLVGLRIPEHQLPLARITEKSFVVVPSTKVVVVNITFSAGLSLPADTALARRQIKIIVREYFHPLHFGPTADATSDQELILDDTIQDLKTALLAVPGLQIASLTVQTGPSHYKYESGKPRSIQVKAGEIIDARLRLDF